MLNKILLIIRELRVKILSVVILFSLCFSGICLAESAYVYEAENLRNPFTPLITSEGRFINLDKEKNKGELALEGIIYDESGSSYALINSQVLSKGDSIEGYQVLRIERERVLLAKEGEIKEISITKEEE